MGIQRFGQPPGPVLPAPIDAQLLSSIEGLEDALRSYPWFDETTVAVKASIAGCPVFQYAHRAGDEGNENIYDTKIRIASVTKVFTVLAVLLSREQIGWDDSIAKFIPGLNKDFYEEVTVGALAGQTSGLGRFVSHVGQFYTWKRLTVTKGYVGDLALIPGFSPARLGLPDIAHELPGCDVYPGGKVCSRDQVLEMFNNDMYRPTMPNSGPLYSNVAYNLLGMALENVHSKKYEQIIQEMIFDPIGMRNSSFESPTRDDAALLPRAGEAWFSAPFGNFNPSGGIWSTPNDMLRFLEAVQTNKLLSAAQTRKWLQPSSLLPSLQQLVGAPWEIFRPDDVNVAIPRPIDLYTKAGGVAGYASHAVMIPEYGIALTIHAASNDATAAVQSMLPLIAKPLIMYADELARKQAAATYSGTYRSEEGDCVVALELDEGPGLRVRAAVMNGVDIIPALTAVQGWNILDATARLHPTTSDSASKEVSVWTMLVSNERVGSERGFAEQYCASWNWGDKTRYAGQPLDKIIFHTRRDVVTGMELVGWRKLLTKAH